MQRRTFIVTGSAAGASALVFSGCKTNPDPFFAAALSGLTELAPLLPKQSENIKRAIQITKDLEAAFKAGKFNTGALFENLADVLNTVESDLNLSSEARIKLAFVNVAVNVIAKLLVKEADTSDVAAAIKTQTSAEAVRQRSLIEAFANSGRINRIFSATRVVKVQP